MEPLRVMLCCIGRLENPYIREFVEYYKNLGITNICLYDNNFDGEEDFRDVIGDYIDSGYVILKNVRNKKTNSQTFTPDVIMNTVISMIGFASLIVMNFFILNKTKVSLSF